MIPIDGFPGRQISINAKAFLYFGGTSYLGLQSDPEFQELFIENIRKYGTGYGASRKSNIQIMLFEEVETYLAHLVGSEACITMSSGYLAGQLLCDGFSTGEYALHYAPNTHSALYRNGATVYKHWDALRNHISKHPTKTPVVFLDSIDFYGENFPEYEALRSLPLEKIIVVVDDSHGIGITGEQGEGSFKFLQALRPKELIVSCSLGKGFGVQAGAIFATRERIQKLSDTPFFGGASPAAPAALATLKHAHGLCGKKRALLKKRVALFTASVAHLSRFTFVPGHPSFSFQHETLATYLETNGILTTNFRYPTEASALMSRIVLNAEHTVKDVQRISSVLNDFNAAR